VPTLTAPPSTLVATREALRALACYGIAPARKARTGRIGLRPTGDGIGTPPFDDGSRIVVRADRLIVEPGRDVPITTVRAAAELLGVALSPDPGVGSELPPYAPDDDLAVDAAASRWLGTWYAFGSHQLDRLAERREGTVSEAQLWPEHFDLAVTVDLDREGVNVGFSPGDTSLPAPYVHVGPHDTSGLEGRYWNAPFGAVVSYDELIAADDPDDTAAEFIENGLRLLVARRATPVRVN
jgi:hypothetical protein